MQIVQGLFAITSDDDFVREVVFPQCGQGKFHVVWIVLDDQDASQSVHHSVRPRFGNREIKGCASVYQTFSPDSSSVTMDDTLHGGQSYASPLKGLSLVKGFEYAE